MPKQLQVTEQEKIRREKLEELKKLGINPYPAELFPVNNFSSKLIENFNENQEVIIAGRIMSRRIQGNASFAREFPQRQRQRHRGQGSGLKGRGRHRPRTAPRR